MVLEGDGILINSKKNLAETGDDILVIWFDATNAFQYLKLSFCPT